MLKQWKVTYEILYTNDTEPTRYEFEFRYFETAMTVLRNTEKHQNLLSFTIERITEK